MARVDGPNDGVRNPGGDQDPHGGFGTTHIDRAGRKHARLRVPPDLLRPDSETMTRRQYLDWLNTQETPMPNYTTAVSLLPDTLAVEELHSLADGRGAVIHSSEPRILLEFTRRRGCDATLTLHQEFVDALGSTRSVVLSERYRFDAPNLDQRVARADLAGEMWAEMVQAIGERRR